MLLMVKGEDSKMSMLIVIMIRPLSKLALSAKIALFFLIFIASPYRPIQVVSSMRSKSAMLPLKIGKKIFDFFGQSEFRKRSIFLFTMLSGFPSYEEEFQESYYEFYNDDLIAAGPQNDQFLAFIHDFSEVKYPILEEKEIRLYQFKTPHLESCSTFSFDRYITPDSTIVDYGAGQGAFILSFAPYVGLMGKLVAFESNREDFKALYWNLTLNQVQNAKLYCMRLNDKTNTLDALKIENVSLIRINMLGDETPFLKGAWQTITRDKPVLYLKMAGGLPLARVDRYIQQVITKQLDLIHQMGYRTEVIGHAEYLALPQRGS